MRENLIEIIGIVSGVMAIIGIPGILDLMKWRKKLNRIQHNDQKKIQKEYLPTTAELSKKYINTAEKLYLPRFHVEMEPIGISKHAIRVVCVVIILFLVQTYLNHKPWGETFDDFKKIFKGEEIEYVWSPYSFYMTIGIYLLVELFYFGVRYLLRENRSNYYSFLYDDIRSDGITKLGKKYGYITERYKEILPCVFDEIKFYKNFLLVNLNGKEGLISKSGKVIIPIKYDEVETLNLTDKYAEVREGKKSFRISRFGKRSL